MQDEQGTPPCFVGFLGWFLGFLLSPRFWGYSGRSSAPSDSVVPSLVAVPALSHTRGHSCCTGF